MGNERIVAIPRESFDSKDMTDTYQLVNLPGLRTACVFIRIINASNKDIDISYNGVIDHDYLLAQQTIQISSFGTEKAAAKNLKMYVKGKKGKGFIFVAAYTR